MDVLQASFSGGEMDPRLHGRVDLPRYASSLASALNCQITVGGAATKRAGLLWVAETQGRSQYKARLIAYQFSTEQTYQLEFGENTMRVIRDGALVLDGSPKTVTAVSAASPGVVTAAAHGYSNDDEVYLSGITSMPSISDRTYFIASATTNTFTLKDRFDNDVDTSGLTAFAGTGAVEKIYEIATPYSENDLRQIKTVQSADTMWLCHPDYAVRKLTRTGHASWVMATETFAATLAAPASISATFNGTLGSGSLGQNYVVTAVDDSTGEESVASSATNVTNPTPDAWPVGSHTAISWAAVTGATRYRVYKSELGVYGFIGSSATTTFNDRNVTPDISQSPPITQSPFNGSGDYPSCATFYEQRLIFAGTDNKPATFTGSQTTQFRNFNYSRPALATDSLEFTLVARKVNRIRALVPLANLVALTTDAEFVIQGAGDDDFLSASNPGRPKAQTFHGAADIEALVVGGSALFVQSDGRTIRDFNYEFVSNRFAGSDLSVVAAHLAENKQVVAWAYAAQPDSTVYVVFDDGTAAGFSYIRESQQAAVAWFPLETDGTFEDVSVIREGDRDVPYFIVTRTASAQTKRYVEKLGTREFATIDDACFVDSARSYDGSSTTVIYGFDHLLGRTVKVLADGNEVSGLAVAANGSITLPVAASKIHAGLGYTARATTLPLSLIQRAGPSPGRRTQLSDVVLRVHGTRGIKVGPSIDKLSPYKDRRSPYDDAIEPVTGTAPITISPKWSRTGQCVVQSDEPLPLTLLSVLANVSAEDA